MPRKSKLQKVIEAAAETPPTRTFQPYTYIRCKRVSMWGGKIVRGEYCLFMGWITNGDSFGDNAVRLLVAILFSYYPGLKLDPQPQVVCACGFLILN